MKRSCHICKHGVIVEYKYEDDYDEDYIFKGSVIFCIANPPLFVGDDDHRFGNDLQIVEGEKEIKEYCYYPVVYRNDNENIEEDDEDDEYYGNGEISVAPCSLYCESATNKTKYTKKLEKIEKEKQEQIKKAETKKKAEAKKKADKLQRKKNNKKRKLKEQEEMKLKNRFEILDI
jgi:hypothetical protein